MTTLSAFRLEFLSTEVLLKELKARMARLEIKRDSLEEGLKCKGSLLSNIKSKPKSDADESKELQALLENDFEEDGAAMDLFSNERCARGPEEVLKRALEVYKFDVVAFVKSRIHKDPLAMARLVNFVRARVAAGDVPNKVIESVHTNVNGWQENDAFLTPFLGPDDAMLWWGDAFSEPDDGDLQSVEENNEDEDDDDDGADGNEDGEGAEDDYYFDSYGRIDIHEEMLRDVPRTKSYLEAFQASKGEFLTGSTVMDVGAGTGVLSMLAVREGGAAKFFRWRPPRTPLGSVKH
jgi:hypothetical protein